MSSDLPDGIVWADPPKAEERGYVPPAVWTTLRANREKWARVRGGLPKLTAQRYARGSRIGRNGNGPGFEAVARPSSDGTSWDVYVRYVGEQEE